MSRSTVEAVWSALLRSEHCRACRPKPRLKVGRAADFPKPRDHAYTDGWTVTIAPRMLEAPLARVIGVLAHELGHVALIRAGRPEHTERRADEAAEEMFGFRVLYDDDDVQNAVEGVSPRPARLG